MIAIGVLNKSNQYQMPLKKNFRLANLQDCKIKCSFDFFNMNLIITSKHNRTINPILILSKQDDNGIYTLMNICPIFVFQLCERF